MPATNLVVSRIRRKLPKTLFAIAVLAAPIASPAIAQTTYTPNGFGGGTFYTPQQQPLTGLDGFKTPQPSPYTYYTPNPTTGGGTFYTPQQQPLTGLGVQPLRRGW